MKPFTYERAHSPAEAAAAAGRVQGAKFIAGGTNLLDLMKLQIEAPAHLIDVNNLGLDKIEPTHAEFRERMSGNICRCGAYSNIQEAIAEVAGVKS